jgi:hypothetical protein
MQVNRLRLLVLFLLVLLFGVSLTLSATLNQLGISEANRIVSIINHQVVVPVTIGNKPVVVLTAKTGDSLRMGISGTTCLNYSWLGPVGFSDSIQQITLSNLQPFQSGTYRLTLVPDVHDTLYLLFHVTVRDTLLKTGEPYSWPAYSPTVAYNFKDEYPTVKEPQGILTDIPVAGTISSGWWAFSWGDEANALIDSASINPLLKRMNEDFAYFRDSMGWPPDKRAINGFKSTIFLYGSGLTTDHASNTDKGGWQSSTFYKSENWPMVLLSYYPVYCFNPACRYADKVSQQGAVVHEGIHSILADLPGCKQAAWFQEGGNTWLQQEANSKRTHTYYGMGFLNVASFLAPFMPIECYSGWLQDGSFGGPSAEGVNRYENGKQVCTWRNLLGGVQYSNVFPVFMSQTLGSQSVAWVWRHCESRVLEGLADGLGDVQLRRLITEYRAKQTLMDMGNWTYNLSYLMNSYMGAEIKSEWEPYWYKVPVWVATPYISTSMDEAGWLIPEPTTLPGWTGANQIPLMVNSNEVLIDFMPLDPAMTCQLCYRTSTGKAVYSQVVYGGNCRLQLTERPANGVVFAVITNTDYIYKGEETRKKRYDYRVKFLNGITSTADIHQKWYDWATMIGD